MLAVADTFQVCQSTPYRLLLVGARWRGKAPVPVLHALGWKCVGVWSITMVATHLPPKAYDAHMISFNRPSSRLTNSFFPASNIVIAQRVREKAWERGYVNEFKGTYIPELSSSQFWARLIVVRSWLGCKSRGKKLIFELIQTSG